MPKPYELLIFDWDGTLMDSPAKIVDCLRVAVEDAQLEFRDDKQLRHIIGLGIEEAVSFLYPQGLSIQQRNIFIESYRYQFMVANQTPAFLYKGVEEMLAALREAGYYLAIATGKGRAGLNQVLGQLNLQHYFPVSRCADETCSKPDPQMLHEILTDMDMTPDQALMIGDTQFDLQMARYAKMDAVAVSNGAHTDEQLLVERPLTLLPNIANLVSWLDNAAVGKRLLVSNQ